MILTNDNRQMSINKQDQKLMKQEDNQFDLQCEIDEQQRKQDKFQSCIQIAKTHNSILKRVWNKLCSRYQRQGMFRICVYHICNHMEKSYKLKAFTEIKKWSQSIQKFTLSPKISTSKCSQKKQSNAMDKQEYIEMLSSLEQQQYCRIIKQQLFNIGANSQKQYDRVRSLEQIKIKTQQSQIKQLREQIEHFNKRMQRENQKKKESLQMLAEELEQKNQVISELRKTIKYYQLKLKIDSEANILQDEIAVMRKQIQNFERIRQRLQNDLNKARQNLQLANYKLQQAEQKIRALQNKQNEYIKISNQYKVKSEKIDGCLKMYENLIKQFKSKNKQLSYYIKQIQQRSPKENISQTQRQTLSKNVKDVQSSIKFQVVMNFIANVSYQDCSTINQDLFNQEQCKILYLHMEKWADLEKKARSFHKMDYPKEELSDIMIKGVNKNENTIFEVLDSPKMDVLAQNNPNSKFTTKLLQVQLQKNRLFQKISQLKQKLFHIRVVILNLLKTLQIQMGKNNETSSVLQIIFDIFEYSEQERESITPKKKKIFGFI